MRVKVKDGRRCMEAEKTNKQKSFSWKNSPGPSQTPLRLLVGGGCYLRLTRVAADVEHKGWIE
jgi:hypothetical protein